MFPELEYIFKHALTQEVAYNSLLVKRRKQIHENIGKAIEEIYAERLEEFYEMLAYHYSKSENFEKAVEYLKMSGEKALEIYANEEAYNFFRETIKTLQRMPVTEENKKAELEISNIISGPIESLSFPEDSLEILQNGERLAKELGDKEKFVVFYTYIAMYYNYKGKPLEVIKYSEPRFYEVRREQDVDLMPILLYGLINSYLSYGHYMKIADVAPEVITLLEENKNEAKDFGTPLNIYSHLRSLYGLSLIQIGKFEEGRISIEKALDFAIEINDVVLKGVAESVYGIYYVQKGDGKNTIEHFQNAIKYFEEVNFPFLISTSWLQSGCGYYLLGDLYTAKTQIEKGLNIYKNTPAAWMASPFPLFLSHVHYDLGDFTKAHRFIEEALELAQKNQERYYEGLSMIWMGRILARINSSKNIDAEKNVSQGIKILEELKVRPSLVQGYFILGELYANTGRKDEALLNLNKALSMCQEMGIQYWPDKIQEVLDRL